VNIQKSPITLLLIIQHDNKESLTGAKSKYLTSGIEMAYAAGASLIYNRSF
jgi:hypothetical protein